MEKKTENSDWAQLESELMGPLSIRLMEESKALKHQVTMLKVGYVVNWILALLFMWLEF